MATINVPVLSGVFQTEPLAVVELVLAVAVAAVVFVAVELEKWMKRRRAGRTAPLLVDG